MILYKVLLRHLYSQSSKNLGTEVNKKNWKIGADFQLYIDLKKVFMGTGM